MLKEVQEEEHNEPFIAVNFQDLVDGLTDLSDDAPIRFVIFAGITSKKPLTTINLTMSDLRKFGKITEAFS